MKCGFSFIALIIALSAGASTTTSGNTDTPTDCEQQLTPATMADLRELYYKSVSPSLPQEQRLMAASLYKEKLATAAAAYSASMKQLHEWVLGESGKKPQRPDDSSHISTSAIHTPTRLILIPQIKHVLAGYALWGKRAAFSLDGSKAMIISGDGTTRIWDTTTGAAVLTNSDHEKWVTSPTRSPDNTRVVTTHDDHTAVVYDAKTRREICTLEGHLDVVYSAFFSPDGTMVITSSADSTARIWNATTGNEICNFGGQGHPLSLATFSPDGKMVLAKCSNHTVLIWDLFITEDELLSDRSEPAHTSNDRP